MSWVYHDTNRYGSMTQAEMEQNVDQIYAQLYSNYTWAVNAICAVLGNIQRESYINPAQTQGGYPVDSMSGGYGLCMWTPASKIKRWLQANNHSIYSGYWQVYAMNDPNFPSASDPQYTPTNAFPLTYDQFKHSGQTVAYLTEAFMKNYEKAGTEALQERIQYAENWYRYIMGTDPPPTPTPEPPYPPDPPVPPEPDPSGFKRKSKLSIYLRSPRLRF